MVLLPISYPYDMGAPRLVFRDANQPNGSGIPNYIDQDSDGDGELDKNEKNEDLDQDGKPNYQDDDTDGDGIPDTVEGEGDFDHDGTP